MHSPLILRKRIISHFYIKLKLWAHSTYHHFWNPIGSVRNNLKATEVPKMTAIHHLIFHGIMQWYMDHSRKNNFEYRYFSPGGDGLPREFTLWHSGHERVVRFISGTTSSCTKPGVLPKAARQRCITPDSCPDSPFSEHQIELIEVCLLSKTKLDIGLKSEKRIAETKEEGQKVSQGNRQGNYPQNNRKILQACNLSQKKRKAYRKLMVVSWRDWEKTLAGPDSAAVSARQ